MAVMFGAVGGAWATEYHVAKSGSDSGPGSSSQPFLTIQKAATVMQPGDGCTVHEGTYREEVIPPRGGNSEAQRITYRAADNEKVYWKGSDQFTNWTVHSDNTYQVSIPNAAFGAFNPYTVFVKEAWMGYGGGKFHRGQVFYEGEQYREQRDVASVIATPKTWCVKQDKGNTVIYANFGGANPNAGLAEVTMRKSVFRPIVDGGVNYITLRGFRMSHAAPNWSPPSPKTSDQEGLITTFRGGRWIIERNIISDSRTVGIVSGSLQNNNRGNYETMGHHIVRGNIIRNCGQSGICGRTGWAASLIEGNLIEEINPLMEFGGWETAGIKIHASADYTIRNNVIRGVYGKGNGVHHGIWIDWANQNMRITGNIIYNTAQAPLYFEKGVGGHLVDNNVIVGSRSNAGVKEQAHQVLLVHNLMINAGNSFAGDGRQAQYWHPHTYNQKGSWTMETGADRIYNNIYVGVGPGGKRKQTEHPNAADFNVYYKDARKASFEGAHSRVVSDFDPGFTLKSLPDGAEVTFAVDAGFPGVTAPIVTSSMLGTNFLTGAGMEHPDGTPMDVTTDLFGAARGKNPTPGPFEKLNIGTNTFRLTVGLGYKDTTSTRRTTAESAAGELKRQQ